MVGMMEAILDADSTDKGVRREAGDIAAAVA